MLNNFPPTIILRHRKENLKKCSLKGLERREDFLFLTYPQDDLPSLDNHCLLGFEGPCLTEQDNHLGLFILDATWKKAEKMFQSLSHQIPVRALPEHWQTAYPRCQLDCPFPQRGLASIEAIFAAYLILGRDTKGLLDNYYWKDPFLRKNQTESSD